MKNNLALTSPDTFKKFIIMHTAFLIFTQLPGVFINTFLMGQTNNNVTVVLLYNLVMQITDAVVMLLAAHILQRFSPAFVTIIGIGLFNLLYLILVLLNEHAADYYLLLGALVGAADGFYWLSYGHLLSAYTTPENRDSAVAKISFCGSIVNLVIPLISGAIISKFIGTKGYLIVFIMAFAIAICTAFLTLRLPIPPRDDMTIQYKKAFFIVKSEKCLHFSLASQMMKGVREGAFLFIFGVILFSLVKNEFLIGVNTFLCAIAALISYAIMNKMVKLHNRVKFMLTAVLVLFLYNIAEVFMLSPMTIIIFSVLDAFCTGFIVNSCYSTFLDAVQAVPEAVDRRPELIAFNETALIFGRSIGLVFLVIINTYFSKELVWQVVGLLFLTMTQFITIILSKKATFYVKKMSIETVESLE